MYSCALGEHYGQNGDSKTDMETMGGWLLEDEDRDRNTGIAIQLGRRRVDIAVSRYDVNWLMGGSGLRSGLS